MTKYPVTPDGRYFVVRGILWRSSDPALAPEVRDELVRSLMQARRDVGTARRKEDTRPEIASKYPQRVLLSGGNWPSQRKERE
jgi:hypothetical protein